jgi:hypothetical protein
MSEKYTLRQVQIEVSPGVILVSDVTSMEGIEQLLTDLKSHNLIIAKQKRDEDEGGRLEKDTPLQIDDTPSDRIERNADLQKGCLSKQYILAFKDGIPQLLRTSIFDGPTDAALVLVHAVETGLKTSSMAYEAFKGLYEAQNLKSGTPLSMLMTNLRNSGYIDKSTYKDGRKLRLTPKGEKQAISILKKLSSSEK